MNINEIYEHDSRTIQQAINKSCELKENKVVIPRINPRTGEPLWEIKETIFLPSDFTLVLDNCHLRMTDGVFCNMFCNANAYTDDCTEQCNISIIGVGNTLLDGGIPNGLTEKTSNKDGFPHILNNTMIFFRNVSGFEVKNLHMKEQRWWGMTFTFCSGGTISDIDFNATNITPNQDGIDLRAGCHDIVIQNISGRTGDDTIALTALGAYRGGLSEMLKIEGKSEDVYNVIIRNVHSQVTGGHHIVRLLNHDGVRLYNILIDGIVDCSDGLRAKAALKIGDARYSHIRKAVLGETRNITARNIISRAKSAVKLGGTVADSYFSNIQQDGEVAIQSTDCEVENLLFDSVMVKNGGLYNFDTTRGRNVVIKNVVIPVTDDMNICNDSLCPEIV